MFTDNCLGEGVGASVHKRPHAFGIVVVFLVRVKMLAEDPFELGVFLDERGVDFVFPQVNRAHVHAHEDLNECDAETGCGAGE